MVSNTLIMRFRPDDIATRVKEKPVQDSALKSVLSDLQKATDEDSMAAERVLVRYAVTAGAPMCERGAPERVRLRYVFHKFPGWSQRTEVDAIGAVETIDSRWVAP